MKERPILFNDDMVRAVLSGRKDQTRRVIKHQKIVGFQKQNGLARENADLISPYGKKNDGIWVREAWAKAKECNDTTIFYRATDGNIKQRALDYSEKENRWRPSIHMHRCNSRINLKVKNIRVERVQDISEEDAINEGLAVFNEDGNLYYSGLSFNPESWFDEPEKWHCDDPRTAFFELWDSINLDRGYGVETNPWVWVVDFIRDTQGKNND